MHTLDIIIAILSAIGALVYLVSAVTLSVMSMDNSIAAAMLEASHRVYAKWWWAPALAVSVVGSAVFFQKIGMPITAMTSYVGAILVLCSAIVIAVAYRKLQRH